MFSLSYFPKKCDGFWTWTYRIPKVLILATQSCKNSLWPWHLYAEPCPRLHPAILYSNHCGVLCILRLLALARSIHCLEASCRAPCFRIGGGEGGARGVTNVFSFKPLPAPILNLLSINSAPLVNKSEPDRRDYASPKKIPQRPRTIYRISLLALDWNGYNGLIFKPTFSIPSSKSCIH